MKDTGFLLNYTPLILFKPKKNPLTPDSESEARTQGLVREPGRDVHYNISEGTHIDNGNVNAING